MKNFLLFLSAFFSPAILLALLEAGLRMGGYAANQAPRFIPDPDLPGTVVLNPFYTDRYFNGFFPGVSRHPFPAVKPNNTFRIFVLGGSSTAGFPYQFDGGFPSKLQTMLRMAHPQTRVEVINLGVTAFSSFAVLDLARHLTPFQPDAVLIYSGHNEFYGAMGSASNFNLPGFKNPAVKRLLLRLWDLRITWLFRNTFAPEQEVRRRNTLMAGAVQQARISKSDPLFQRTARQFHSNLLELTSEMNQAGIAVFAGTLTSNLRHQAPLGKSNGASSLFDKANNVLASSPDSAKMLFFEAKEADPLRFRSPDTLNVILDQLARENRLHLVHIDSVFHTSSPEGIAGDNLFTDHLHPNATGYHLMAEAFAEKLEASGIFPVEKKQFTSEKLLLHENPLDGARARLRIALLKSDVPFTIEAPAEIRRNRQETIKKTFLSSGYFDSLSVAILERNDDAQKTYQQAISHAANRKDTLTVLKLFRGWLAMSPVQEPQIAEAAAKFVGNNVRWLPHLKQIALSAALPFEHPVFPQLLSSIFIFEKNLPVAEFYVEHAARLSPEAPITLLNQYRLASARGDSTAATSFLSKFKRKTESGK